MMEPTVRQRIDGMRQACLKAGIVPEEATFRGIRLLNLSREQLETIIAYHCVKQIKEMDTK